MISHSKAWVLLSEEQKRLKKIDINYFLEDPRREKEFSCEIDHLLFDYSKNRLDKQVISELIDLAKQANLEQHIADLFAGKPVNFTEERPALHMHLRSVESNEEILTVRGQMRQISDDIRTGKWLGYSGLPITDIINIGIGGSDLGPSLIHDALQPYQDTQITLHFISNVDPEPLTSLFKKLNPATTLFIVASKSFTTQETLTNASSAKNWLLQHTDKKSIDKHFIAATAKPEKALSFGISKNHILPFWDWVGGRYSLWSAIGLPIAIIIGMDRFEELLAGARSIDHHFRTADFSENIPILMALIGIWYINFWHMHTQAIIPYAESLAKLPSYVQQLDMESNGKSINRYEELIDYHTAPIIWGTTGTNSQHASHQLLHQGTPIVPVDYIIAANPHSELAEHQDILFANCLAQAQALAQGKTEERAYMELLAENVEDEKAKKLARHKIIPGNKPSNLFLFDKITPFTVGMLIALYEYKVFTQSIIWEINAFDQWGVELGKELSVDFLKAIKTNSENKSLALEYYKNAKK